MDADNLLSRARGGDSDGFNLLVEPYRRELLVYCYRMVGTLQDAEDLLQDILLRAWLNLNRYESRASLRTWLYRIATNACLDLLKSAPMRRLVPLTPAIADAALPSLTPDLELHWIEPLPESWYSGLDADPELHYSQQESISLAFIAMIQKLPIRQRAILILRDVLNWQAQEVAQFLDSTPSAVNSALLHARKTLQSETVPAVRPLASAEQHLLDRYLKAWNQRDIPGLLHLLRDDVVITMPPMRAWYNGSLGAQHFLQSVVFPSGAAWLLRATRANGQPAFALYQRTPTGYAAFCLQALRTDGERIVQIDHFVMPPLFARFGLPSVM
ncbi:MAG: RNA polymerase subunit sigma-70 [Anaerolineae bacterium]|nr:RNA polymerase subunit sigma-70 [Anaerolineae bacterium]